MDKTKILFVSQEITPYLPETEMSKIGRYLPQGIQEKGNEIRSFMPRYGLINERRNQLHEVIRLSGMNLIIDENDHPLIIKVASIQSARMQIYFIDNDDFYHRKYMLTDKTGKVFDDNIDRAVFFVRGVIETVKKLRWAPDVIHCQGWISALLPLYLKKAYKNDPLFQDAKVLLSVYDDLIEAELPEKVKNKIKTEGVTGKDLMMLKNNNYADIYKLGMRLSDGIIKGSPQIDSSLEKYMDTLKVPILDYKTEEEYLEAYNDFYHKIIGETVAV